MPKISEAQRETRRDAILAAALSCFARDGFHATTTADIAREAGVSQGSLYLYFATKDDMVVALAHDRHDGESFVSALAEREQNPVQGLRLMVELHGRSLGDPNPDRAAMRRVNVQGWGEALRNPTIRASVIEGLTDARQVITRLIERGQRTGQVVTTLEADALARLLIANFQGLLLQVAWGEPVELAACGKVVGTMIRDAVLTPLGRESWSAELC